MPTVKHFAPKTPIAPAPAVPFSLSFARDGVEEVHEFEARPRITYGDVTGLFRGQGRNGKMGVASLTFLDRMIRRSLRDDDGTPARWEPEIRDGQFTGPDGKTVPVADLDEVTAFEVGSSRRRWVHLMEIDDDVTVEIEQIAAVFEYLTGEAGDRPT